MSRYDDRSRKLARQRYWNEHNKDTYQCPDCGRRRDEIVGEFQVHHKSGNPHDNRLEKLVGLCGYCHRVREGKKPSLKRLRGIRDNESGPADAQIHPFVRSFIDERLCLCSEGSNQDWVDVIHVHFNALDSHLDGYGYEISDKFKTELIAAYRLLPGVEIEWRNGHQEIKGPDAHGRRGCDCLTCDDFLQDVSHPGDWR